MSFRDIRTSDNLFSKTNRNDRYKQMTKQQQLIEEKKRQIQEKLELEKKKIAEGLLKAEAKVDKKPLIFSNDGSFLDQFKKLSGMAAPQDNNLKNGKETEEGLTDGRKEELVDNSESSEIKEEKENEVSKSETKDNGSHQPTRPPPPLPPDAQGRQGSPQQYPPLHLQHNSLHSQPVPPLTQHSVQLHPQHPTSQIPPQLSAQMPPHPGQMPPQHPGQMPPQHPVQMHPGGPIPPPHPGQVPPQHSQPPHYMPYTVPPPPPPPPVMPPMMPQSIPPPLVPQSIPPPRPLNVQNIPPPPLSIPPPPLPPCFPPPPQFSLTQTRPPIPNLLIPPPTFNNTQVPAENVQGNSQSDRYSPQHDTNDEKDSPEWFQRSQGNSNSNSFSSPVREQSDSDATSDVKEEKESEQNTKKPGERKRKSRWGDEKEVSIKLPAVDVMSTVPKINVTGMSGHMLTKVTRTDPGLLQYALTAYGSTSLTEEDWKKAEENYKVHLLYQDMMAKREALEKLREAGKNKYEYDSDEEIDEKGTWEHKLREKEMIATQEWAESLTEMAKGKHHIGDFLPPDELKKFLAKYNAAKGGIGEPDLSDYKEYKLGEENKGFQMLQKLGWTEGQGLGSDGAGRLDPINKGQLREFNEGLGHTRPDDISTGDDEYDAYRKRMMLAYRFRPNPLNNPRRPYY